MHSYRDLLENLQELSDEQLDKPIIIEDNECIKWYGPSDAIAWFVPHVGGEESRYKKDQPYIVIDICK